MNAKRHRHRVLLDLVGSRSLSGQEALAEALGEGGIQVTQSTLSKDLKELGVAKVPDGAGGFRYRTPSDDPILRPGPDLLRRELEDFVARVDGAGMFVVVKTMTGHAQGVCEAIDRAGWDDDLVGTIAGENTIFILCRSEARRRSLQGKIDQMTGAAQR